jgi:hypothetical protein
MIQVFDDFLADPGAVRQSALGAGFGTWRPNKGDIGAAFYDGVSFWGDHATLFRALHQKTGAVIPSSMFFRITNPQMEHALIHSDREYGEHTAIVYLSKDTPSVTSGTGFYRHRETGMTDMPALPDLMRDPVFFQKIRQQMLDASDADWEMYRFVEARYNRCVVFDAPKIHCRLPKTGFGETENTSRMVWVCHFNRAPE